jgi:transcriptional regulator with XRE-family HTH domain
MAELDLLIGKRLQTARKALGFKSARSFARQHGIPESTYSQHETGKRSLNPTTMVAYCERLNVNPGWLVTGEDNTNVDTQELQKNLYDKLGHIVTPEQHNGLRTILQQCFGIEVMAEEEALA